MLDRSEERKAYREKNRELLREKNRAYYARNKDKVLKRTQEYKQKNSEIIKQKAKKYREDNKDKIQEFRDANREYLRQLCRDYQKNNGSIFRAKKAKRRAKKLKATPSWLSQFDVDYIKCLYAQAQWLSDNTQEDYHIDHIYPLQGTTVSGLHVPTNLQILEATENLFKSNKCPEY